MYTLIDIVGLIGVALVIGTYLLLQMGRLSFSSLRYSCLNLLGSILILFSLYFNYNLSSIVIEVIWLSISAYGIVKYYRNKNMKDDKS